MSCAGGFRHIRVAAPDRTTTVVLVRDGAEVARWPLPVSFPPDLNVVDRLARLQLVARRRGCAIQIHTVGGEVWELLDLAGLAHLVRVGDELVVEVGGQPEGGEQRGIDEVVMPDDPAT